MFDLNLDFVTHEWFLMMNQVHWNIESRFVTIKLMLVKYILEFFLKADKDPAEA